MVYTIRTKLDNILHKYSDPITKYTLPSLKVGYNS